MVDNSSIEWTEATWNPVTGCDEVSPGCAHCYAKTFAERWRGIAGHPYEQGFDLRLWPERLDQPLFHEEIPFDFIQTLFAIMARANHHTFQVLTKRKRRACSD
jgi:protein gp37